MYDCEKWSFSVNEMVDGLSTCTEYTCDTDGDFTYVGEFLRDIQNQCVACQTASPSTDPETSSSSPSKSPSLSPVTSNPLTSDPTVSPSQSPETSSPSKTPSLSPASSNPTKTPSLSPSLEPTKSPLAVAPENSNCAKEDPNDPGHYAFMRCTVRQLDASQCDGESPVNDIFSYDCSSESFKVVEDGNCRYYICDRDGYASYSGGNLKELQKQCVECYEPAADRFLRG